MWDACLETVGCSVKVSSGCAVLCYPYHSGFFSRRRVDARIRCWGIMMNLCEDAIFVSTVDDSEHVGESCTFLSPTGLSVLLRERSLPVGRHQPIMTSSSAGLSFVKRDGGPLDPSQKGMTSVINYWIPSFPSSLSLLSLLHVQA